MVRDGLRARLLEPGFEKNDGRDAVDAALGISRGDSTGSELSGGFDGAEALVDHLHLDAGGVGELLREAEGAARGGALLAGHLQGEANQEAGGMAVTMAGCGLPPKGGAQAIMRFTPAALAVTTLICAEATMGYRPPGI